MKIAVVGATGLVGREIIKILESKSIQISGFLAVASKKSVGKSVFFAGKEYEVISLETAVEEKPDIAIFSAGANITINCAPKIKDAGTTVIDNSSAWRMAEEVPLIVPEINVNVLTQEDKIIANPNCSTIQLVMALYPLNNKYGLKRLVVSTYQSVSGSGGKGVQQLMDERNNIKGEKCYPHQIDLNVIPQGGDFTKDGYTTEEVKLVKETQKILQSEVKVTATVVRVPVIGGHSEAVNAEFENDFVLDEVKRLLGTMPGVVIFDFPEGNMYPMPILAEGKDEVFVGRLRRDFSQPNSLNMWIVSDNLRKGAATNAVQIASYIIANKLI